MTSWFVHRIAQLRLDIAYLALDMPGREGNVATAIAMLRDAGGWSDGTTRRKIGVYVLVGYNGDTLTDAERRCQWLLGLSVRPFPMLYRGPDATAHIPREWGEFVARMLTAFRVPRREEDRYGQ